MTRINVGFDPKELPDKALLAEHREITRIPNAVRETNPSLSDIPPTFKLGTGHVKFFYNKLAFLQKRYASLYAECIARGFDVTDKSDSFVGLDPRYYGEYQPTDDDRLIIFSRLTDKGHAANPIW